MFSRITLLCILRILHILFSVGLISLVVAFFSKLRWWSFNFLKHFSMPLTWIISRKSFLLVIFLLWSLIVLMVLEFTFLKVLENYWSYGELLVFSENYSRFLDVNVFFDDLITINSLMTFSFIFVLSLFGSL